MYQDFQNFLSSLSRKEEHIINVPLQSIMNQKTSLLQVIDLLKWICTVSVETMKSVGEIGESNN
jgi:hypothetical protein